MLKDAILAAINRKGFTVTVRQKRNTDGVAHVSITCNRPTLLVARAVSYAREVRGLGSGRAR